MAHLVMHRGRDHTFELEVNREGEDQDLTGATLDFVAYTAPDAAPLIDEACDILDPEQGLASVTVPAASTDTVAFSEAQNTTLFYVLRRTVGAVTDVLDTGMLIVRAVN